MIEGTLIIVTLAAILTALAYLIKIGINSIRTRSTKNGFNVKMADKLFEISTLVNDEVEKYMNELDPSNITLSDIDDIVLDIMEIVRETVGENITDENGRLSLKALGINIDLEDLIRQVISDYLNRK